MMLNAFDFNFDLLKICTIPLAIDMTFMVMVLVQIDRMKDRNHKLVQVFLWLIAPIIIGISLMQVLKPYAQSAIVYLMLLLLSTVGGQVIINTIVFMIYWDIEKKKKWEERNKEQEDQANKPDNKEVDQAEQKSKPDDK